MNMNIRFVLFSLLLIPFLCEGQEYNKLDSLGRKQGVWVSIPDSIHDYKNNSYYNNHICNRIDLGYDSSDQRQIHVYETYVDNRLEGPISGLLADSTLVFRGRYKGGYPDDWFYEYTNSGIYAYVWHYDMGKLYGFFLVYSNGNLSRSYLYKRGVKREEIVYEILTLNESNALFKIPTVTRVFETGIIKYNKRGQPYDGRVYYRDFKGKICRVVEYKNHKVFKEYQVGYNWETEQYEFLDSDLKYPESWEH